MTPLQKAKELSQKFIGCYVHTDGSEYWLDAKRCGIICCDEIMAVLEKADEDRGRKEEFRPLAEYSFWDEVKKEIEEL